MSSVHRTLSVHVRSVQQAATVDAHRWSTGQDRTVMAVAMVVMGMTTVVTTTEARTMSRTRTVRQGPSKTIKQQQRLRQGSTVLMDSTHPTAHHQDVRRM